MVMTSATLNADEGLLHSGMEAFEMTTGGRTARASLPKPQNQITHHPKTSQPKNKMKDILIDTARYSLMKM